MKFVLQSSLRSLLSVSTEELTGLCNALNAVCNGVDIADFEFETRLGVSRIFLAALLAELTVVSENAEIQTVDRVSVWAHEGSVQAVCITAFGDPADMSVEEAKSFADQLLGAIGQAEEGAA
jgi:hypothetical protein